MSENDIRKVEFVQRGFTPSELDEAFYKEALASKSSFIKGLFTSDLRLRNAKVSYLNKALGRAEGTDIMDIDTEAAAEYDNAIASIFSIESLLDRERAIDDFLWKRADELNLFNYFTLDNILGVVAKLCIIERWLALDDQTGRELLARLIGEVRGSYGNIEFDTLK